MERIEPIIPKLQLPAIMGILNVTPDSFSDGGLFIDPKKAVEHARTMVLDGAQIIDIGGESTRPFAEEVSLKEELRRVLPVVKALSEEVDVPISVDTRHPDVAIKALASGASVINDVNGLKEDGMEELVVETGATAVIMHMKGTPGDMQVDPSYDEVISEIHDFLSSRVERMTALGCEKDKLIIDPGIGFGKRVEDNLTIIRDLHRFGDIGCPILIGASRKSFIGKVLNLDVDMRLEGSITSAIMAYLNGASILRVHDVKETKRALDTAKSILKGI
jgi:dihydropteroate synthase